MTVSCKDHKGRPIVAVTGMGVVTSLGQGLKENWTKLTSGQSGIREITRFSTDGLRTRIAGCVDFYKIEDFSISKLCIEMAVSAIEEAICQAAIGSRFYFPGPLFLATPPAELEWHQRKQLFQLCNEESLTGYERLLASARAGHYDSLFSSCQFASVANHIADRFGTQGLPYSVSTACASGASAIQLGVEAIRRGDTQAVLCVGTDASVQVEALIRFSLLSALSTQNSSPEKAMKPFSKKRDGFVMAEGAGALVLEEYDSAVARGAGILGVILGCGEKADDYHRTRPNPDGKAIIGAMNNAFEDAGISPWDVDYINAHGTSTAENDRMEYLSLSTVMGDAIHSKPVSSNKSMIGHTLSAAGLIEAVFSLMSIKTGILPPTINYYEPDPEILLDVVPHDKRYQETRTVLSNSFGFGGQNVCLIIGDNKRSHGLK